MTIAREGNRLLATLTAAWMAPGTKIRHRARGRSDGAPPPPASSVNPAAALPSSTDSAGRSVDDEFPWTENTEAGLG